MWVIFDRVDYRGKLCHPHLFFPPHKEVKTQTVKHLLQSSLHYYSTALLPGTLWHKLAPPVVQWKEPSLFK